MTTLFSHGLSEPEGISIAEMEEVFGRELSWADVQMLWDEDGESPDQCRARLRGFTSERAAP